MDTVTQKPSTVINTEYFDPDVVNEVIARIRNKNVPPYEFLNIAKGKPMQKNFIAVKNPHATNPLVLRSNSQVYGSKEIFTLLAGQSVCGFFWNLALDESNVENDRDIKIYFTQGPE